MKTCASRASRIAPLGFQGDERAEHLASTASMRAVSAALIRLMSPVLLALLPALCSAKSVAAQDDAREHRAFLSVSYKANRERFSFGTFRFKYIKARAASLEDALEGPYTESVTAIGLYVFDEGDARFEIVASATEQAGVTKEVGQNQIVSLFGPVRMLTDNKTTLVDRILIFDPQNPVQDHSITITPGTDEFYQKLSFPLEIGSASPRCSDLSTHLDQVARGGAGYQLELADPNADLDGRPVTKIVLRAIAGRRTFWIDRERGSIPLKVEDTFDRNPSRRDVILHQDLRLVEGGGWIPFTRLTVLANGGVVERIELLEAKLERPKSAAFQLDFPSPVPLMDTARKLRYKPRAVWDLHHLPSERSADSEKAVPVGVSAIPEMPGEMERPSVSWRTVLLLLGLVFLAAALLRIAGRWLSRRRG